MCFIVCFIIRSRVKPNLHHSSETNSAKEDTGDAPVFLSLSSQPPQIFARNKIIKGLTPPSHTPIYTEWPQWLQCGVISDFSSEEAERLLHHSDYLLAEHMGWWQQREDLQNRLSSICCKTLFMDYFHTMILKNQGQKEKGEHNFSMAFLPNTWHKCRDWRPAGEESFCWLCLPCASQLLNYTITTHRAGSEISLSGMSFIKCK